MAFGAIIFHHEQDLSAGYQRLPDYVPVKVDLKSSDFLYQINRPVPSGTIAGVMINRLSKWSVAKMSVARVVHIGNQMIQGGVATAAHAFRLELDINTVPEPNRPLPKDRLAALYDEFVALGTRIVERGDELP